MLPPPHVELQFAPQVPLQFDLPSHVVVQPVPQSVLHVFWDEQLYVALLGAEEEPPSAVPPPSAVLLPLVVPIVHEPPD